MPADKGKINFIKTWFDLEKKKLPTVQQLELLKRWIASCVLFEEYEMAAVLRIERGNLMRHYRNEINGKRGIIKKIKIRFRYLLNKFKKSFHRSLLR